MRFNILPVLVATPLLLAAADAPAPAGYLGDAAIEAAVSALPPPPPKGSAAEASDRAIYAASVAAIGGHAWQRAETQLSLRDAAMHRQLECALGVRFDKQHAPALTRLITRSAMDLNRASDIAKARYDRPRPYAGDAYARACDPRAGTSRSPSYPSGHSAIGWMWGLMLAEVSPADARAALALGRELGDNRIACRVHYASDVEAGRLMGAALLSQLQAQAAFRHDIAKAKAEVRAAERRGAPEGCA